MIRTWYRSRLFWLGLPGFLFLLSLSSDLGDRGSVSWRGKRSTSYWLVLAGADSGEFRGYYETGRMSLSEILYGRPSDDYGFRWNAGLPSEGPSETRPRLWPPVKWEGADQGPRRVIYLRVAVWVLLLGYGVVWMIIFLVHQHRKARLLKASAALTP